MLNPSKVITYIKNNLAFPFQKLELEDDYILEYISNFTLEEFSRFIPDTNKLRLDPKIESVKVPDTQNEYYINDPDGLQIISVKTVYFNFGNHLILGHPIMGAFSQMDLRQFILDVEVSQMVKQYSMFNFTYTFKHPNILRISPIHTNADSVIVEYERVHEKEFSTIPNEFQIVFLDLCLADIMILIGRVRRKYGGGNLRTPFGEIPLQGEETYSEGQEKKREIMDKLNTQALTNIVVDFG